jgi:hypothetical protein
LYGWVCDDCFDELVERGMDTNIVNFMRSDAPPQKPYVENVTFNYFDDIFPS